MAGEVDPGSHARQPAVGAPPSRRQTATVAACFAAAAFTGVALTTARLLTPDAYLDLYAGRWIAAHGLPRHDPFTVEGHGRAWIDQQWLAHLVYYRMWQLGGYPLVGALSALLVAIAVGMAAWLIVRRTDSPGITLAVLIPAYLLMLTHTQIWAESFAIPLFTLLVALIYDDQRQPDTRTRVLLAIPLIALWANLHGTVLMGAAIAAAYGMWGLVTGRSRWRCLTLVLLSPLAAVATPYGADIGGYYRSVLGNAAIRQNVNIWGPWSPHSFFSIHFAATALLAAAAVVWAVRRGYRPDTVPAALAAGAFLAGVYAIRYQVWFAIPVAIVAAEALAFTSGGAPTLFGQTTRRAAGAVPLAAAAISAVVLAGTSIGTFQRVVPAATVTAVSHTMRHTPCARVLADYAVAPALLWQHPELAGRIGFDTRFEIYPQSRIVGWFRFNDGAPGWDAATAGYDLLAISSSRHPQLAARIRSAQDWRVSQSDGQGLVASRPSFRARCE
ncbi:MAG TPA: hypothetical protein VN686_05140 [Gaiellales bacterium]|nr:hypothetical protein [Gaiellales bacterium]